MRSGSESSSVNALSAWTSWLSVDKDCKQNKNAKKKLGVLLQCVLVILLLNCGFAVFPLKCGLPKQYLYGQRVHVNYIYDNPKLVAATCYCTKECSNLSVLQTNHKKQQVTSCAESVKGFVTYILSSKGFSECESSRVVGSGCLQDACHLEDTALQMHG